jgi:hypothetical protein
MNNNTKKLAAAALAAAAISPMAASAAPSITQVQQASNAIEATFSNTFSQTAGVSGSGATLTATLAATGVGLANTDAYQLTPNFESVSAAVDTTANPITLGAITSATAAMGANAATGIVQMTGITTGGSVSQIDLNTSVFGVSGIKATQSVIDSVSTTLF